MATLDSSLPQAGEPVVIYDRRDCGPVHGLGVQERVAACYRWASARGHVVLDRFVSWDSASSALPASLSRALDLCTTEGASLLVYAEQCLGDAAELREAVIGHLAGRPALAVVGEPHRACAVTQ